MHDQIAAAHDGAPQREHRLIGRLGVDAVGGVGARGAIGQPVAPGQLAADDAGLHVFGRAEGGRAGLHVDIRGEAAIDEGRAGLGELRERQAGQRLGILLDQRAGQRHRRHGAGQREGRDHATWPWRAISMMPMAIGAVELERRIGVDHRVGGGLAAATAPREMPRAMRAISRLSNSRARPVDDGTAPCRTAAPCCA